MSCGALSKDVDHLCAITTYKCDLPVAQGESLLQVQLTGPVRLSATFTPTLAVHTLTDVVQSVQESVQQKAPKRGATPAKSIQETCDEEEQPQARAAKRAKQLRQKAKKKEMQSLAPNSLPTPCERISRKRWMPKHQHVSPPAFQRC
ncbi:hypothetical protein WJX77_006262 [Trebouxia sp. C0004]